MSSHAYDTSLVDPLQSILRRLDLLRQYQIRISPLDLGKEEREDRAADAASKEDYNNHDNHEVSRDDDGKGRK